MMVLDSVLFQLFVEYDMATFNDRIRHELNADLAVAFYALQEADPYLSARYLL